MATSGQVGTIKYTLQELLDAGFRGCRIPAQKISAEMLENGRGTLQRFLSALPASVTLGWSKENLVLPVPVNKRVLTLPAGTIDVSNVQLRTYQRVGSTLTDNNTNLVYDMAGSSKVTAIGIRPTVAGTFNFAVSMSNDNSDWFPLIATTPITLAAEEMRWFELPEFVTARYLRVTGLKGFEVRTFFIGGDASETDITRGNHDDYVHLPSTVQGAPNQFWFDRQDDRPLLRLWPIPDATVRNCSISLWRKRQIEDVGDFTQEIEIPQRWYEAIIDALAYRLAFDNPEVDISIVNWLKPKADEAMNAMANEEPDHSPIRFHTGIRGYTR